MGHKRRQNRAASPRFPRDLTLSVVVVTDGPSAGFEQLLRGVRRVEGIQQAELLVGLYGPDGLEPTTELLALHLSSTHARIESAPNTTAGKAASTAAARARGRFVIFVPEGVAVPPDLLVQVGRIMSDPAVDAASGGDLLSPLMDGTAHGAAPGCISVVRRAILEPGFDGDLFQHPVYRLALSGATIVRRAELEARPLDRRRPKDVRDIAGRGVQAAPFSATRVRPLLIGNFIAAGLYSAWWLRSGHVGTPVLFAALAAAEGFSLLHVLGLWWTVWFTRIDRAPPASRARSVDVFVTTCGEPLDVLARTVTAAVALERPHQTFVLDDAGRPEVAALAKRLGAAYIARATREGAKAGNLNNAFNQTTGELCCVLDADHVPQPDFLERVIGYFEDPKLAFVQTPQFYVNAQNEQVARGAYQQQAIFYGPICRGKNGLNAAFCCGTNVVFRRAALEDVGGFDERSLVEDFVTSIHIHAKGWRSVYYPYVLAEGLGPAGLESYFRQQFRWARGSVGALVRGEPFRGGLSLAQRLQYLLATTFYLTGLFTSVYIALPILYLIGGWSAFSPASGDFVFFYVPYLILGLVTIRLGLGGQLRLEHLRYTFGAFPVYAAASVSALLRLPVSFRVTGAGSDERFPPLAGVTVAAFVTTAAAIVLGLVLRPLDAATFTNLSWAAVNLLLLSGVAAAAARELRPKLRRSLVRSGGGVVARPVLPHLGHLQLPERVLAGLPPRRLPLLRALERTSVHVVALTLVGFSLAAIAIAAGVYAGLQPGGSQFRLPRATENDFTNSVASPTSGPVAGRVLPPSGHRLYWGAFVQGAPFTTSSVSSLEGTVDHRPAIVMWFQEWHGQPPFPTQAARRLASRRIVPMITWEPWKPPLVPGKLVVEQPKYRLARIAAGSFDAYIRSYAEQVRRYGKPVLLRPFHEMDGFWYPWGGTVNGNTAAAFVAAWRHIHHIFDQVGATNVTWVWSVNHESVPDVPRNVPARYWPGARYVDWIGISGFNWGTSSSFGSWISFNQIYRSRIRMLLGYHKPILLAEIGAVEVGGDKARWIRSTFTTIVRDYPQVKALVWYDRRDSRLEDWRIDSSAWSVAAFRSALDQPELLSAPTAHQSRTPRVTSQRP